MRVSLPIFIGRAKKGLPVLPRQESALRPARQGVDGSVNRPYVAYDLAWALARDPKLIEQAACGNTGGAVRAMAEEQRVRLDRDVRADRFVEGWQAMQRQRASQERSGDSAGDEGVQAQIEKAAGGPARDPHFESALRQSALELKIRIEHERSIGDTLTALTDRGDRQRDRGMSR